MAHQDMQRILLKTTIPYARDDWHIRRFSLLHLQLSAITDEQGEALFEVLAHDRRDDGAGNDSDLQSLFEQDIEQLWLFAVGCGIGLSAADIEAIDYFRQRGGACLLAKNGADSVNNVSQLSLIGSAFTAQKHTYDSGANGDYQVIQTDTKCNHAILQNTQGARLHYLPAHPQESPLQIPLGCEDFAQVIAQGRCQHSQQPFNLAIAVDATSDVYGYRLGRAVLDASFQRFVDYNLDPSFGCPSFLNMPSGNTMLIHPQAREETNTYFCNIALWLAGEI